MFASRPFTHRDVIMVTKGTLFLIGRDAELIKEAMQLRGDNGEYPVVCTMIDKHGIKKDCAFVS